MSKFTPGPWIVIEHIDRRTIFSKDENDKRPIARTVQHGPKENEANARLIAAAPGLYEALKSAISCMSGYEELQGWVRQYKQAIKKAEGK